MEGPLVEGGRWSGTARSYGRGGFSIAHSTPMLLKNMWGANRGVLHAALIQFVQRNWKKSEWRNGNPKYSKKSRGRPAGRKYSKVIPVRLTADTIKAVDCRFRA